ncbi:MAG TPA: hypothetical protein VFT91_11195 [Dehalococcoidia bacterium]|nr:hypothetical protein [Dehalococcoidia bacterium]
MIFIDRSIPKGVADALKAVRDDVRWLEDEFQHDAKETEWLPEIGKRGWLVISRDKKIRTRPGERRALVDAGVGCFILAQKQNLTRWDYLKLIAASLDEMEEAFASTRKPFIYTVGRTGQLGRVV